MKIFTSHQIRLLDRYTIAHEPISSIDLMERAASALYNKFVVLFSVQRPVLIFAGPGNNGGDALALARMLLDRAYNVKVILMQNAKLSADCQTNKNKLFNKYPNSLVEYLNEFHVPEISPDTIIIDGLFGSGLTGALTGVFADTVNWVNSTTNEVVSIDLPSGLQGEENNDLDIPIVKADYTLTFQFPKLAFLLADNEQFVGNWEFLEIGIHPDAITSTQTNMFYLERSEIQAIIKPRPKFSHKGTFGHLLLLAGRKGMAGAAVLSAKAALRSGAGLVSVHSAESNRIIVQSCIPEAIFQADNNKNIITECVDIESYNAIAVGPGLGTKAETTKMLKLLLETGHQPIVLDADALNIISTNKDLLKLIPQNSIITPHPKEFDRLFEKSENANNRMLKVKENAQHLQIIIVLKGAHTLIALPDGTLFFNSTGNSGMATAGTGDVLTGIIGSLLAQSYSPDNAAKLGVYIHGLAADLALKKQSKESLIASDIIDSLGDAFKNIYKYSAPQPPKGGDLERYLILNE